MNQQYPKDEPYEVLVNHRSDLLTQDLILSGIFLYTKLKDFGVSFDFPHLCYNHITGDISYPVWQIQELRNHILSEKEYKRLIQFLENEQNNYRKYLRNFEKFVGSGKKDTQKIIEYFNNSLKTTGIIPYFAFEFGLHKLLEEKNIPIHSIPSTLTDTTKASQQITKIAEKHRKELDRIKKENNEKISLELENELKVFCHEFGYLGMKYFLGHPWTISDAFRMLIGAQNIPEKKQDSEKEKMNSPYIQIAADLLRLRTLKWELNCYGCYLFREYILQHHKEDIMYEELLNLRVEEVINTIQKKYLKKDLSVERASFILEVREDGVHLLLTETKKEETKIHQEEVQEIKGMAAQPGKVTGIVKVVLTPKEGGKVNEGDILVTAMSTPDFLPVMRRAAAFVTDIGGITSHAAIVSREMEKPCIIGTKIATKVLRDGDIVEVDANHGIVKILERKK